MKRYITIYLLCLISLNALAQVTLDDCQRWARENYPEVKRYDIINATEACNLSNASKNWLPMVSLKAQGGWTNSTPDIDELTDKVVVNGDVYKDYINHVIDRSKLKNVPNWQYRAGMEVTQPIYDGGATRLQREVAQREAEADRAKIAVSLHTLEDKVIDVYFAILLLEERKQQATSHANLLDKNLTKLRHLQEQDIINQNEVDAVDVERLKLKQEIDVLEENLETYRTTLSLLTGQSMADKQLVAPELPTDERPAYSQMAEMQLLDKQSELLSLKTRYEKVKTLPKIGLLGQVYYGFPGGNLFKSLVNRNPTVTANIGVSVTWDISPFFRKKGNLRLIQLQQQTIDNSRELLIYRQNLTNVSLESKLRRLQSVSKEDEQIIALQKRLREAEEVKVDNDVVDATDLLRAIEDEADARLQSSIHKTELLLDIYKLRNYGDTQK